MSFIRPQQDLDKPQIGEHYYEGVVVDNQDPDFLHRIKVRVEELHGTVDNIPDDHLPWAVHFRPTFLGGGADLSLAAIPRIGSKVTIQHIRGNIYQPVYLFELSDNSNKLTQAEQNYPESYVLRDSDDNYWHVDMVDDKLDIKFNGNECLEITVDRTTTIGQDDVETVGRDKVKTVQRDEINTIERDRQTQVTGNEFKTVNNTQTNLVNIDRVDTIGSNLTQTVGQIKTVTAPTFNINSSISLNINSPSVNVNSGTITVTGGDVIADGISLKNHTHPPDTNPPA